MEAGRWITYLGCLANGAAADTEVESERDPGSSVELGSGDAEGKGEDASVVESVGGSAVEESEGERSEMGAIESGWAFKSCALVGI